MKTTIKTFEEFIGDETVKSLRIRAAKVQHEEGDKVYVDEFGGGGAADDGEDDNDNSGTEMGSDA
jgi:hypothetical protein